MMGSMRLWRAWNEIGWKSIGVRGNGFARHAKSSKSPLSIQVAR